MKVVRSDNGTEFMCLSSYFRQHGIVHQTSCVGTPQQKGRVERKHRHILNVARALLFQASLPIKFWGEAVLTAAYLINRTPTSLHNNRSPYEVIYGAKPCYDQLRVFVSACYTHRVARDKDKFGERSRLCIFVGYPFGQKGWKVFDIEQDRFFISRDVIFREDVFPFAEKPTSAPSLAVPIVSDSDWCMPPVDRGSFSITPILPVDDDIDVSRVGSITPSMEATSPTPPSDENVAATPNTECVISPVATPSVPVITKSIVPNVPEPVAAPTPSVVTPPPRQGKRSVQLPARLNDYVLYNATSEVLTHHALLSSNRKSSSSAQGNSLYSLTNFISDDKFSAGHRAYLAAITSNVEPKSFKDAVRVKVWNDAMFKEVDALEINKTWDIVDLPPRKLAIGSQWVYKTKYNADGSIERYKARLVIQGNKQVEGEDYNETFAPIVKMTTVRILLRLVAAN